MPRGEWYMRCQLHYMCAPVERNSRSLSRFTMVHGDYIFIKTNDERVTSSCWRPIDGTQPTKESLRGKPSARPSLKYPRGHNIWSVRASYRTTTFAASADV